MLGAPRFLGREGRGGREKEEERKRYERGVGGNRCAHLKVKEKKKGRDVKYDKLHAMHRSDSYLKNNAR